MSNTPGIDIGPQGVDKGPHVPQGVDIGPQLPQGGDIGPQLPQGGDIGPHVPQGVDIGPHVPQGVDIGPQLPQGVDIGPHVPQGVDIGPHVPQRVDIGPQLPQGVDIGPHVPQGVDIGPQLPQGVDIGPQLPQGGDIGPQLPQGVDIGPQLPQGVDIGPQLPQGVDIGPHVPQGVDIGPQLPPTLERFKELEKSGAITNIAEDRVCSVTERDGDKSSPKSEEDDDSFGPSLPPGFKRSSQVEAGEDDGDVVGPLPGSSADEDAEESERRVEEMRRVLQMKTDAGDKTGRETWMTELPQQLTNTFAAGTKARGFRQNRPGTSLTCGGKAEEEGSDLWTDTPADKERKRLGLEVGLGSEEKRKKRKKEEKRNESARRDAGIASKVEEYNKSKRSKSLVDMHEKSRKKQQASVSTEERRPFDREKDLQIGKMSSADRKKAVSQSAQLHGRFAASSQQRFL